jgi:putative selenate reductase molybdopterin-binding subunit
MRSIQGKRATQHAIGAAIPDIEAVKLATGQPAFTDDVHPQGMLYGCLLTSPHAHAIIRSIDTSEAAALPGVHAVVTYKDVQRIPYASSDFAGPQDHYILDYMVRFVGDRVAAVVAETPELAEQATGYIQVTYDVLPPLLEPRQALEGNASRIHGESESRGIADAQHNVAGRVRLEEGSVEQGFAEAEVTVEREYSVPVTHIAPLEHPTVVSYFDENENLVVRTTTQTPHLIRRTLATLLDLPLHRIRVVRPNVGGSFGTKQGVVLEDMCALLTQITHRPVRLAYSRADMIRMGRVLQQHVVRVKTGVKRDGTIVAQQMLVLASTGAYATHPLLSPTIHSPLGSYFCPNRRFVAEVVYTNTPSSGTSREREPEIFALECHMDEIAQRLDMNALDLRRKNWPITDMSSMAVEETLTHRAYEELTNCLHVVDSKLRDTSWSHQANTNGRVRRGTGIAVACSMNDASVKGNAMIMLNEGGTFDLYVAVADDAYKTPLLQIAAGVLGVSVQDVTLHCTETSEMPYSAVSHTADILASTGSAVRNAALRVRERLFTLVCDTGLFAAQPGALRIENGVIFASGQQGQPVMLKEAAEIVIIVHGEQVIASAGSDSVQGLSCVAHKAQIEVDTITGVVRVVRLATAIESGRVVNPLLAEGQVQGAVLRALNAAMNQEIRYDKHGQPLSDDESQLSRAIDGPELLVTLVESEQALAQDEATFEPGAGVACAGVGVASAIVNAVANALPVRPHLLPLTPERIVRTLQTVERVPS